MTLKVTLEKKFLRPIAHVRYINILKWLRGFQDKISIFELPSASVSKRVYVTYFCRKTRFEAEAKDNKEMAYFFFLFNFLLPLIPKRDLDRKKTPPNQEPITLTKYRSLS